jgi:hypothetical protein
MKIFRLVLISFFLITSANSNSIYNLIKIPNLEIYELKTPINLNIFMQPNPLDLVFKKTLYAITQTKKLMMRNIK